MDFFIGLDSKGRLVLPLEIREALGIKTNGKIAITISDSGAIRRSDRVILELAKASENDIASSISFSKNGRYLKEKRGDLNG